MTIEEDNSGKVLKNLPSHVIDAADKKTWLFTMIAGHITLLLGLYQVLAGRIGIFTTEVAAGTSVMKDKFLRYLNNKETDECINMIKEEIKLMMYNKKQICIKNI
jgi:hypothetical protein